MPRTPDIREIEEARAYILQRLTNQRLLEDELSAEFKEAAERIALIVMKYRQRGMRLRFTGAGAMPREIEAVIEWLRQQIDEHVNYYCIPEEAEEDEEDDIIAYIHGEDHGYTYEERETLYMSNFLMALNEMDFDEYDDIETIVEAISEAVEQPEKRMNLLALNSVAIAFAYLAEQHALARGTIGFITYPGSSNPCPFCTDRFYIFQPITNERPPYHPRCACLCVYVFE